MNQWQSMEYARSRRQKTRPSQRAEDIDRESVMSKLSNCTCGSVNCDVTTCLRDVPNQPTDSREYESESPIDEKEEEEKIEEIQQEIPSSPTKEYSNKTIISVEPSSSVSIKKLPSDVNTPSAQYVYRVPSKEKQQNAETPVDLDFDLRCICNLGDTKNLLLNSYLEYYERFMLPNCHICELVQKNGGGRTKNAATMFDSTNGCCKCLPKMPHVSHVKKMARRERQNLDRNMKSCTCPQISVANNIAHQEYDKKIIDQYHMLVNYEHLFPGHTWRGTKHVKEENVFEHRDYSIGAAHVSTLRSQISQSVVPYKKSSRRGRGSVIKRKKSSKYSKHKSHHVKKSKRKEELRLSLHNDTQKTDQKEERELNNVCLEKSQLCNCSNKENICSYADNRKCCTPKQLFETSGRNCPCGCNLNVTNFAPFSVGSQMKNQKCTCTNALIIHQEIRSDIKKPRPTHEKPLTVDTSQQYSTWYQSLAMKQNAPCSKCGLTTSDEEIQHPVNATPTELKCCGCTSGHKSPKKPLASKPLPTKDTITKSVYQSPDGKFKFVWQDTMCQSNESSTVNLNEETLKVLDYQKYESPKQQLLWQKPKRTIKCACPTKPPPPHAKPLKPLKVTNGTVPPLGCFNAFLRGGHFSLFYPTKSTQLSETDLLQPTKLDEHPVVPPVAPQQVPEKGPPVCKKESEVTEAVTVLAPTEISNATTPTTTTQGTLDVTPSKIGDLPSDIKIRELEMPRRSILAKPGERPNDEDGFKRAVSMMVEDRPTYEIRNSFKTNKGRYISTDSNESMEQRITYLREDIAKYKGDDNQSLITIENAPDDNNVNDNNGRARSISEEVEMAITKPAKGNNKRDVDPGSASQNFS